MPQEHRPKKRRRVRRPGLSPRQRAWVDSPRGKAACKAAGKLALAVRRKARRCGAKRRGGLPCQRLPTPGKTRCKLHGGAHGVSGSDWHIVQWPEDPVKRRKKEAEILRRRAQQAARVVAMTPEQRARYDRWHETHRPGPKSDRAQARQDREAWQWLSQPAPSVAPDAKTEALLALRAELRDQAARLEALLEGQNLTEDENSND